jgi:hypothetical protein
MDTLPFYAILAVNVIILLIPLLYVGLKRRLKFILFGTLALMVLFSLFLWLPRKFLDKFLPLHLLLTFLLVLFVGGDYDSKVGENLEKDERIVKVAADIIIVLSLAWILFSY